MGFLEIMQETKAPASELKILILGLDNAGKTTILNALSKSEVGNETPTQGFNMKTLQHDQFKLSVYDIGGQETLRAYWNHYLQGANALVYVVDSADHERCETSVEELKRLLAQDALSAAPLLVYCNKQDVGDALSVEQVTDKIGELGERVFQYQACSATQGNGVDEGMKWVIETLAA